MKEGDDLKESDDPKGLGRDSNPLGCAVLALLCPLLSPLVLFNCMALQNELDDKPMSRSLKGAWGLGFFGSLITGCAAVSWIIEAFSGEVSWAFRLFWATIGLLVLGVVGFSLAVGIKSLWDYRRKRLLMSKMDLPVPIPAQAASGELEVPEAYLAFFWEIVAEAIARGEKVSIGTFGQFSVTGRMSGPRFVVFRAGRGLKEALKREGQASPMDDPTLVSIIKGGSYYAFRTPEWERDARLAEVIAEYPVEEQAELKAQASRLIEEQTAAELTWDEPTTNDRIAKAFERLNANGIVAVPNAGFTQSDGWAKLHEVCSTAMPDARGGVFFTSQDVDRGVQGLGLWLAWGAFYEKVRDDDAMLEVGREIVAVLTEEGVSVSWGEHPDERIEIEPFEWRQRQKFGGWEPRDRKEGTPPFWVNMARPELRAQLGTPDWGSDELDAWLSTGVSARFDGNERARIISYGISFASKVRPYPRYTKSVLGIRLGDSKNILDELSSGQPLEKAVYLQSETYTLPSNAPGVVVNVEFWKEDYESEGETFKAGTVRSIEIRRTAAGPERKRVPPSGDEILLCVFCCGKVADGIETCPHCQKGIGEERIEMTPTEYASEERVNCPSCNREILACAFTCPHCQSNTRG